MGTARGSHTGSLHWRVEFEGRRLRVAPAGTAADCLQRIADRLPPDAVRVLAQETRDAPSRRPEHEH